MRPAVASSFAHRLAIRQNALRDAITAAARIDRPSAAGALVAAATLPSPSRERARMPARDLAAKVRAERREGVGADTPIHAFSLSSDEGIALVGLAEALLRIPDAATADALIRDATARASPSSSPQEGRRAIRARGSSSSGP